MPVEALPLAQRQLLEIARGLYSDAKVLILDEPTATLSDVEIARVHTVVRGLVERGHGVVYITHRLGEVFTLSDRITVMRSGKVVASDVTAKFTMDEVVTMMLGHEHTSQAAAPITGLPPADERREVTVENLSAAHQFSDVSFTVPAGEVLTIFGQIGSGADQVIRALAGLTHMEGTVRIDGQRAHHRLPPGLASQRHQLRLGRSHRRRCIPGFLSGRQHQFRRPEQGGTPRVLEPATRTAPRAGLRTTGGV